MAVQTRYLPELAQGLAKGHGCGSESTSHLSVKSYWDSTQKVGDPHCPNGSVALEKDERSSSEECSSFSLLASIVFLPM